MTRGLYTAATGMNLQVQRMDLVSNDLANVNTTGYKKETAIAASFDEVLVHRMKDIKNGENHNEEIGKMTYGVALVDVYTRFDQGSFQLTGDSKNLAIKGDGFFVVETENGNKYTRDGAFNVANDGTLVTKEGYPVQGANGAVSLGEEYLNTGGDLAISEDGTITINGEYIDTIQLVQFEDNQALIKEADNLYSFDGEPTPSNATIVQGYLETSNVNSVNAMVDMITVSRAYEASQKLVQAHDELMSKAVNEVGRA
ncbi:MAG: flagellar basal-body rod protein FlgF [Epulopiscium sp. Nele67-Bin005]|nr:MAG: flagellar basal-body rod protein FlgF [Epulopiscium sp. Nele67-Bin005]